jgi:hypothetical protein
MAHKVNRNAFLAAKGCGHALLSAYGQLIATELALKDQTGIWGKGHDIAQMLDDMNDPGLTALGTQLRTRLSAIPCTTKQGKSAIIRQHMYPELRYARHINDHVGGTTDAHLDSLVQVVEDIIVQLHGKGISI